MALHFEKKGSIMSKKLVQIHLEDEDHNLLKEIAKENNRTMRMQALFYIQKGMMEEKANGLSDN